MEAGSRGMAGPSAAGSGAPFPPPTLPFSGHPKGDFPSPQLSSVLVAVSQIFTQVGASQGEGAAGTSTAHRLHFWVIPHLRPWSSKVQVVCPKSSRGQATSQLRGDSLPWQVSVDTWQVTLGMSPAPRAPASPGPFTNTLHFDSSERSSSCQMKYLQTSVLRG